MTSVGRLMTAAAMCAMALACTSGTAGSANAGEPWGSNTLTPAELVRELSIAAVSEKPVVVCTAPTFLYRIAHIPGSVLNGPASSPEGLSALTTWARSLPTNANVVIYCGCCPMSNCPNLRPAYTTLRALGLTRVRVLVLPDSFGADWVARGYPIEK